MPETCFDLLEVDETNKFAIALCRAVIGLEEGYSPLLIHSPSLCTTFDPDEPVTCLCHPR